jgi:hypothetical protein
MANPLGKGEDLQMEPIVSINLNSIYAHETRRVEALVEMEGGRQNRMQETTGTMLIEGLRPRKSPYWT